MAVSSGPTTSAVAGVTSLPSVFPRRLTAVSLARPTSAAVSATCSPSAYPRLLTVSSATPGWVKASATLSSPSAHPRSRTASTAHAHLMDVRFRSRAPRCGRTGCAHSLTHRPPRRSVSFVYRIRTLCRLRCRSPASTAPSTHLVSQYHSFFFRCYFERETWWEGSSSLSLGDRSEQSRRMRTGCHGFPDGVMSEACQRGTCEGRPERA
ncbi:hypothetical protein CALCODRAFT_250853 [Calocera cornea HHB12733]|uniref:Uncharacterized protein n=1 Tax=Calocera cornea HHB12733 TaxID=1353952 RepID=A0A165JX32_9BASI|nr:hypothetical protein CALCODRAFT_250853 [Calocera cornea HHB12733]